MHDRVSSRDSLEIAFGGLGWLKLHACVIFRALAYTPPREALLVSALSRFFLGFVEDSEMASEIA